MFKDTKVENIMRWLTISSLYVFSLFSFTSFSLTAGVHIFLVFPGLYFSYKYFFRSSIDREPLPSSAWALLALIIVSSLSVVVNFELGASLKGIFHQKYYLVGGIFALLAFREIFSNEFDQSHISRLLKLFLFSTSFASMLGVMALYLGHNPITGHKVHATRASGMYGMCMTYAYGIGFVIVVNVGLILYKNKILKYVSSSWLFLSLFCNTLGFVLSAARGAILGLLFALPFLFWEKGKKWVLMIYSVGFLILFCSVYFTEIGNKVFLQRQDSNSERASIFKAALYAAKENPVLGIGYKNFEKNSQKIKLKYGIEHPNFSGNAHNNFLEYFASAGIVGGGVFIIFLFFWLKEMYFRKDYVGYIGLAFIVYLIVSGMVQYTFGDGENAFVIMMGYALSLAYFNERNTRSLSV